MARRNRICPSWNLGDLSRPREPHHEVARSLATPSAWSPREARHRRDPRRTSSHRNWTRPRLGPAPLWASAEHVVSGGLSLGRRGKLASLDECFHRLDRVRMRDRVGDRMIARDRRRPTTPSRRFRSPAAVAVNLPSRTGSGRRRSSTGSALVGPVRRGELLDDGLRRGVKARRRAPELKLVGRGSG